MSIDSLARAPAGWSPTHPGIRLLRMKGWALKLPKLPAKVRADGTTLASEFSCLILDNASIHNDEDLILKMKTHIHVMFIPPYCYHLSPLDFHFGAYGLVERFLRKMGEDFGEHNIEAFPRSRT
jgi:hypothetical protein